MHKLCTIYYISIKDLIDKQGTCVLSIHRLARYVPGYRILSTRLLLPPWRTDTTHPLLRPSPHSASAARIMSSSCGTPLPGTSTEDGHFSPSVLTDPGIASGPDGNVRRGRTRACAPRHLATSDAPRLPSGVTASTSSSSVSSPAPPNSSPPPPPSLSPSLSRSRSDKRGCRRPSFPASLAAAHAHSSVRLPINWIKSPEGGLEGGASGDEGILSHSDARGLCGRVGVRGGGSRDSERVATRSREGRGRGGVILRRGVCACAEREWDVESVRV